MQIKGGLVDKGFCNGCLSERYRPDLEKIKCDQCFLERLNYLQKLWTDYKHGVENGLTTPKITPI
jgi:hypothetical protein